MKKTIHKIVSLKKRIYAIELGPLSFLSLKIFLPIITVLFLYVLSFIYAEGPEIGCHTRYLAEEMIKTLFLSLFILFGGVFIIEKLK